MEPRRVIDADGNEVDFDKLPRITLTDEDADWLKGAWDFPSFSTPDGFPPPDDDPGWPEFASMFESADSPVNGVAVGMKPEEFRATSPAYRMARARQAQMEPQQRRSVLEENNSSEDDLMNTSADQSRKLTVVEEELVKAGIPLPDWDDPSTWPEHCQPVVELMADIKAGKAKLEFGTGPTNWDPKEEIEPYSGYD